MTNHNEKTAVENLQRYLRQLATYNKDIPLIAIDGIFGAETQDALVAFQHLFSLEETGVADYTTWLALYEAYMQSVILHSSPSCFCPFPRFPVNYSVSKGNRQFLVEIIQYILNELTVAYDDIPRNPQNGIFEEETEQGILEFQRINRLPTTGRVDKITCNALISAYNSISAEHIR